MSEAQVIRMPTIQERENLMKDRNPSYSGFTPRPVQKLVKKKPARSMVNIECNHLLRSSAERTAHGNHALEYRLWLEAGKHTPPFPERPDPNYNSNVWRNFRQQFGFQKNTDGQKVSEIIASMYPLNIPRPSRIGQYTFAKFLKDNPSMIENDKLRYQAIRQSSKEIEEFRSLRLKSETRNPPIDKGGKIIPPLNFKKYAYKFTPPAAEEQVAPPIPDLRNPYKTDAFGNKIPDKPQPYLWKLSYKVNNPEFDKVMLEAERRKNIPRIHTPTTSLSKKS